MFSPDGRRVATTSLEAAQLWDADTGTPVGACLQHQDRVVSVAFSSDGQRVVTASRDGAARVWHVLLESGSPQETSLLIDLSEAVAGYRINELASIIPLSMEERTQTLNRFRELATKAPDEGGTLSWFATIVTPDTLLRWHRQLIARKWTYPKQGKTRRGVLAEIRQQREPLGMRFAVGMGHYGRCSGTSRRPKLQLGGFQRLGGCPLVLN